MKITFPTYFAEQFFDDNGNPLAFGKIYTKRSDSGADATTYNQNDAPNSNPVILDSAGRACIRIDSSFAYKFIVKSADESYSRTYDKIYGAEVVGGSGGTDDHSELTNRDIDNQHPISAITGLEDAISLTSISINALGVSISSIDSALSSVQGDVDQLITEVTNLQGDVSNINTSITTIQGDITDLENGKVNRSGDTMTGSLGVATRITAYNDPLNPFEPNNGQVTSFAGVDSAQHTLSTSFGSDKKIDSNVTDSYADHTTQFSTVKYIKEFVDVDVTNLLVHRNNNRFDVLQGDIDGSEGTQVTIESSKARFEITTSDVGQGLTVIENKNLDGIDTILLPEIDGTTKTLATEEWSEDNLVSKVNHTKSGTGFDDNNQIVSTWDETAQTITFTGTVKGYYQYSLIVDGGFTSAVRPANSGSNYYYSTGGALSWATTSWDFAQLMAGYYYKGTNCWLALSETHGFMDIESHDEFHNTQGTWKRSGGDFTGFTLNSTTPANRRPKISITTLADEDFDTVLDALTTDEYSWLWLSSTNTVNITTGNTEPISITGSRPNYNQLSGGNWIQTAYPVNAYGKIFVMAVPAMKGTDSNKRRFLFIQPQTVSTNLTTIQAITTSSVNLGELANSLPEFNFIGEIIVRYTAGDWVLNAVNKITGTRVNQVITTGGGITTVQTDGTTILGDGVSTPLSLGGNVDATELGYLDGVTSSIQTQLNGKANTSTTLAGYGITDALDTSSTNQTKSGAILVTRASSSLEGFGVGVTGDATSRTQVRPDGIWFGDGTSAPDVAVIRYNDGTNKWIRIDQRFWANLGFFVTGSETAPRTIEVSNADTNTQRSVLKLKHKTSSASANGLGVILEALGEDSGASEYKIGAIDFVRTTANGTGDVYLQSTLGGAYQNVVRLGSDKVAEFYGALTARSLITTRQSNTPTGTTYTWTLTSGNDLLLTLTSSTGDVTVTTASPTAGSQGQITAIGHGTNTRNVSLTQSGVTWWVNGVDTATTIVLGSVPATKKKTWSLYWESTTSCHVHSW